MKTNIKKIGKICLLSISCACIQSYSTYATKTEAQTNAKAQQVYEILNKHRLNYDIDACIGHGKCPVIKGAPSGGASFLKQIEKFVKKGKPIEFFLPSFPFKSPNTIESCIGVLPDMAERKALEYLSEVMQEIAKVYPPGAHIMLLADGRLFNDPLGIPDAAVILYEESLKQIAKDLPHIMVKTLADYVGGGTPAQSRAKINQLVPITAQQIQEIVDKDPKFYASELAKNAADLPGVSADDLAKITKVIIGRNKQVRNMAAKILQDKPYVRLSVHYKADISKKFGIKLAHKAKTAPWFGVAVLHNDGTWEFVPKSHVANKKYELKVQLVNGIACAYYQEK